MVSQKNPWNRSRLEEYLRREEDQQFEVKSSRDLADGDRGKIDSFFQKKVAKVISAFLNSEGGLFIIGIEEGKEDRKDIAVDLSPGIPRSVLTAKQVQDKVFGLISPSSADLVQVYPVDLELGDSDQRLAFVVAVKRGTTAYQSTPDKVYYVRRGSSCDPMDDKDIRLRMLADDRPRVTLSVRVSADEALASMRAARQRLREEVEHWKRKRDDFLANFAGSEEENPIAIVEHVGFPPQAGVTPMSSWDLSFDVRMKNTGYVTIREFASHTSALGNEYLQTVVRGLSDELDESIQHCVLDGTGDDRVPLFPDGQRSLPAPSLAVQRDIDLSNVVLRFRCKVLLNNGRPYEIVDDVTEGFVDCVRQLRAFGASAIPLGR